MSKIGRKDHRRKTIGRKHVPPFLVVRASHGARHRAPRRLRGSEYFASPACRLWRERESTKGPAEARERETMKQPRSLFTSRPRPLTENSFNKNKRKTNPGLRRRGLRGLRLDPFQRRRPLGALFLPRGGGRDRAGGAGGGDAGFPRQQRARQLAAATRADVDAVPRLAALGSLFCEEEDVRMGRPSAAAVQEAKHEKEKEGKEKGKGKK